MLGEHTLSSVKLGIGDIKFYTGLDFKIIQSESSDIHVTLNANANVINWRWKGYTSVEMFITAASENDLPQDANNFTYGSYTLNEKTVYYCQPKPNYYPVINSYDQFGKEGGYGTDNAIYDATIWPDGVVSTTDLDVAWLSVFIVLNEDPYAPGGASDTGGGGGGYDGTSDNITVPSLPSLSALQSGFFSMYSPNLYQLQSLADWMWSTDPVTNLTKLFGDPIKAIIGLSMTPVTPTLGTTKSVKLGNLDSGVSMPALGSQYVQKSCGSITINEFWGNAIDYAPYTQASIYVPYCGVYPVDIDDIMGATCTLTYNIDLLSGACSAMLVCSKGPLNSVVYNYAGNVSTNIPVSSSDWSQLIRSVVTVAAAGVATVATAGAATPALAGAAGSTLSAAGVAGAATSIMGNAKPTIAHGGNISTAIGALSVQRPYFIISRPQQSVPVNYNKYAGLPTNITYALSDITGFTICSNVFIDLPTATDREKTEIETLLKGGVIL